MTSTFLHTNFNVFDLEKSLAFYQKALGLTESRRINASDGSFIIVYLTDHTTDYQLELTCLKDHPQPYELGENESHIAFRVADRAAAHVLHQEMGCICFENEAMGLYFIEDPDGYWLEILD